MRHYINLGKCVQYYIETSILVTLSKCVGSTGPMQPYRNIRHYIIQAVLLLVSFFLMKHTTGRVILAAVELTIAHFAVHVLEKAVRFFFGLKHGQRLTVCGM
jgi:hypothetical protein